jgi:hypothetical protein
VTEAKEKIRQYRREIPGAVWGYGSPGQIAEAQTLLGADAWRRLPRIRVPIGAEEPPTPAILICSIRRLDVCILSEMNHRSQVVGNELTVLLWVHLYRLKAHAL